MFNRLANLKKSSALTTLQPLQFLRFKRTKLNKKGLSPHVVRLVTQLSVMSASRKQPKLLKLCREDLIKHEVITKLWSLLNKRQTNARLESLKKQELAIAEANEDLQKTDKELYELIHNKQKQRFGTRFSLELRIPTKFPPRKLWNYDA